jgi:hypothetical protein
MYGEFGYAAAYVYLFYVLSCVERYFDCFPFSLEGVWYQFHCIIFVSKSHLSVDTQCPLKSGTYGHPRLQQ